MKIFATINILLRTDLYCTLKQNRCFYGKHMVLAVIMTVFLFTGCTDARQTNHDHIMRLNLNQPAVEGRKVVINGGVETPVERIQWNWGDGKVVKHHFFPASHIYNKAGQYQISVTVFDSKDRTSTKSVTVKIDS